MATGTETFVRVDIARQETRVWLQILSLHGNIFASLNSALAKEVGLSVPKFDALAQLDRYQDGLPLGRLSQNLRVTGGNVSGLIQRLMADGLVQKEMSATDRRSFIVRLTPKGASLFKKAVAVHQRHMTRCFETASSAELDQAYRALKALSTRVSARRTWK